MTSPVILGGREVHPGERLTFELPVTDLSTHTPMSMPVRVLCGMEDGPRLFVSAAVHGDEINGVEVVSRLLTEPSLALLRGTLIAVPIVNVLGFVAQSRYLPDRRDLNRSFPGSKRGSLAARLAHLFLSQVVANATHGIDLHTGAIHRANHPQIRADLSDPQADRLARAFGAPVVINSSLREGSLREAAGKRGVPVLVYEAGEALRFDEAAITQGVAGVLAVMRALDMLPDQAAKAAGKAAGKAALTEPFVARSSSWIRAPRSGVLRCAVPLGTMVAAGDLLGEVADSFGDNRSRIVARRDGMVIGSTYLPVVYEGDALFHMVDTAGDQVDAVQLDVPSDNDRYQEQEDELRRQDDALTYA